ncbi:kelch repeat-containing protein [Mucilaginibacter sp. PAMB04274]|uniref:Kelch repeat-containing protein n=1 Tax=Mucilaginibacter sp. PAMB04274 TaxID=3138568 RepID=UPI0031F6B4D5
MYQLVLFLSILIGATIPDVNKTQHHTPFITAQGIVISVQDKQGHAIPNATLVNKTQNYTLLFNDKGMLQITSRPFNAEDEILISCVGYKTKRTTGKEIIAAKQHVVVLEEEAVELKEVVIKSQSEELLFKNVRSLPFPLYYHSCVANSTYAYIIGGMSGYKTCTQALKYDPKSNNWSVLAHNLKPIVQSTATYIPQTGKIYRIGGLTSIVNFTYFDKVETIDVNTGQTEILNVKNPMPSAYGGAAVWKNKIYIFGGGIDQNYTSYMKATKAFYEFDPLTHKFNRLPDMPEPLQATGAIVNGVLYVFGGFDASRSNTGKNIYAYNIESKQWSLIGKLPKAVSANGIAVYNNLIFITGGYTNQELTGFLNTTTGKFTLIKSNFSDRAHLGSVVLYDHLMVIGGSNAVQRQTSQQNGLQLVQVADLKDIWVKEQ